MGEVCNGGKIYPCMKFILKEGGGETLQQAGVTARQYDN